MGLLGENINTFQRANPMEGLLRGLEVGGRFGMALRQQKMAEQQAEEERVQKERISDLQAIASLADLRNKMKHNSVMRKIYDEAIIAKQKKLGHIPEDAQYVMNDEADNYFKMVGDLNVLVKDGKFDEYNQALQQTLMSYPEKEEDIRKQAGTMRTQAAESTLGQLGELESAASLNMPELQSSPMAMEERKRLMDLATKQDFGTAQKYQKESGPGAGGGVPTSVKEFQVIRPDLKPGSPEFAKAYGAWYEQSYKLTDPERRGRIKGAEKDATLFVDRKKAYPKMRNSVLNMNARWKLVDNKIDRAISLITPYRTGVGAWTKNIPSTKTKELEQIITTLQANIGFDQLQKMRDSSPTGGALGQVSELENKLLQAVLGSLDMEQPPSALLSNLKDIKAYLDEMNRETNDALNADYSDMPNFKPIAMKKRSDVQRKQGKDGAWYINDGKGWRPE